MLFIMKNNLNSRLGDTKNELEKLLSTEMHALKGGTKSASYEACEGGCQVNCVSCQRRS